MRIFGRANARIPVKSRRGRSPRAAARSASDWRSLARDVVYRRLAVRDRSVAELRASLEKELVPEEFISETIQKFADANLVDDERFANGFVRARFESKVISRKALAHDLHKKGIVGERAEEALGQISDEDEQERANAFAVRKIRSMARFEPEVIKRRLFGALARRGFSPGQVMRAVEALFESLGSDQADHR